MVSCWGLVSLVKTVRWRGGEDVNSKMTVVMSKSRTKGQRTKAQGQKTKAILGRVHGQA